MPIIRSSSSFPHPRRVACCPALDRRPPATKALHTICGNKTSIVSSSWWWAYEYQKHVEQIIITIKHLVASSWVFFSTRCEWVVSFTCQPLEPRGGGARYPSNSELSGSRSASGCFVEKDSLAARNWMKVPLTASQWSRHCIDCATLAVTEYKGDQKLLIIILIIIIIFINCNWVVTRWQWLFYLYTKHEIGYYWI